MVMGLIFCGVLCTDSGVVFSTDGESRWLHSHNLNQNLQAALAFTTNHSSGSVEAMQNCKILYPSSLLPLPSPPHVSSCGSNFIQVWNSTLAQKAQETVAFDGGHETYRSSKTNKPDTSGGRMTNWGLRLGWPSGSSFWALLCNIWGGKQATIGCCFCSFGSRLEGRDPLCVFSY